MPPLDFLKVPLLARLLKPVTGLATSDARLLDQSAVDLPMDPTIVENVGSWPVLCEGFRMPAATDGSTGSGGRRPKASKERNRDGGTSGGAAGSMGIWPRRIVRLLGFDASE